MCHSRPTIYTYVLHFVSSGLFCRPLLAKKKRFLAFFWTTAFSVVANWQQYDKVEHGCTTTNLPLSNGIKIVSVLQRFHYEIWRTISDVQKRDEQTNLCDGALMAMFTGSIASSASRRYLVYSEVDFEVFRPAGRHVAPMGVKFGMGEGTARGPLVPPSVPNFTPIGPTCRPCGAKNLKSGL